MLDTNALSALAEGDGGLGATIQSEEIALPVIVLGEFLFGVAQSRRRAELSHWVESLIGNVRVVPITLETAHHYANVRADLKAMGRPIPVNDLWIAAQCREHDCAVVSRDAHFDSVAGLKRLSW